MDNIYIERNGTRMLVASTGNSKYPMTYHKASLKLNSVGSMEIHLPMTNVMKESIVAMDRIVYERNGAVLFMGTVTEDSENIIKTGKVTSEGYLARLGDIYMEPYEYKGGVTGFMEMLMNAYNAKASRKIRLGVVTVTDPNDYISRSSTKYKKILDIMMESLVDKLGGYLRIRTLDGIDYIDYLADFGRVSRKSIEYGVNLIDLSKKTDYKDVYTVLIPLGAEDENGEKLTVASVNGGSIYIVNQDAVQRYGWRETTVEYPDVTLPENLLRKGQQLSDEYASPIRTIEVNAVDVGADRWHLGDMIPTKSAIHNVDTSMMLSEVTYYALSREAEYMVLGNAAKTYSEKTSESFRNLEDGQDTLKRYNANMAERIRNASGLYTTKEILADGSEILWQHNKPDMNESDVLINVSTAGMHVTNNGGADWYGVDFNGEWLASLIETYKISADHIYGGTLESIAKDETGEPVTYLDLDSGETFKFGDAAVIARKSGNVSGKWVGEK